MSRLRKVWESKLRKSASNCVSPKLSKIRGRIRDLLHKQSTRLVKTLHERRVGTVVVGDLKGIRESIGYRSKANQKLHQWAYGEFARMIEYKARLCGMTVERVGEAYTSQTCPSCGSRHEPHGREYICGCGFEGHRDLVGATNIRQKYLGQNDTRQPSVSSLRVAGEGPKRSVMASPTRVRYRPHMRTEPPGSEPQRCNPATAGKTSTEPKGSCRQAGRPVG
ncbi:RNA-guided endonuclease InsQ/TnpB family protein [Salinibacter ruber]|uniref:RNA-guided endonuclease InsQ/TnpB family protein n=1 Tax=Salinibacter ruber TaxID=146919 RepID=UPI0021699238